MEINYDRILLEKSHDFNTTVKTLEIVCDFVKSKKLIMVGGQAIDSALRLKGSALYQSEESADYDCWSPDPYGHGQELGALLCEAGLPNVSIIYGMHLTTTCVRVDFTSMVDMSYCPQNVFDNLPYLEYRGFRIIHPHAQMIDQHRSRSYPYEMLNMGGMVGFRWAKDTERHDLLYDYYPILISSKDKPTTSNPISINISMLDNLCIAGYGAYDIYMDAHKIDKKGSKIKFRSSLQIMTDTFEETVQKFAKYTSITPKYFNAFMGRLPRSASLGDITIYDNYNSMVAANKLNLKLESDDKTYNVYYVCGQHVLMYFLHKSDYGNYVIMKLKETPLIITTYGKKTLHESQELSFASFDDTKLKSKMVPKRLYPKPGECNIFAEFDYNSSKYFQIDGKECKLQSDYHLNIN